MPSKQDVWKPLDQDIRFAKGVGPQRAARLESMGLRSVEDLIYRFPKRYTDRRKQTPISGLLAGEETTVRGRVVDWEERKVRSNLRLLLVRFTDGTGTVEGVWFNQVYLVSRLRRGQEWLLYGKVRFSKRGWQLDVEEAEPWQPDMLSNERLTPYYATNAGLSQRFWRQLIGEALEKVAADVPNLLPRYLLKTRGLVEISDALWEMHFPTSLAAAERARRRIVYEELFLFQLSLALKGRGTRQKSAGFSHRSGNPLVTRLLVSFPFELTGDQKAVISQVIEDMGRQEPMARLLQGDVGSGKTVVAMAALVLAAGSGYQAAMMVPTEVLADQHYMVLSRIFEPLGINVGLLTGSLSRVRRQEVLAGVASGATQVVVGTHALIQEGVEFNRLGLAVIDEQHRFGVIQRASLSSKGVSPDLLVMTATPIPRTMALVLYGDLDISVLKEKPPGMKPVDTTVLPPSRRSTAYRFLSEELARGRQGYVVCPLVEESEALMAQAAVSLIETLRRGPLGRFRLDLLHGRLPVNEKQDVMERFRRHETDLLVATTVIEVGVDVPNATVMVIEGAERFGLAQLHQLRGRVGRGPHASRCFLISDSRGKSRDRLLTLATCHDGFLVAESDLQFRGPGDLMGTRQHGLPQLRAADLLRDVALMEEAREDAAFLMEQGMETIEEWPLLAEAVKRQGERFFP